MNIIDVNASTPYKVITGSGLITKCAALIKQYDAVNANARRVLVVTDDSVDGFYGSTVERAFNNEGFEVFKYVLPHGEESKSLENYGMLLEYLADHNFTRSDFVVALGGGMIGDLSGFTAASYLRGIDFVQIPTTLLACVDSSVGGKTAVDLKAGKNLAGAFHQPKLVVCDLDTLDTLPEEIFTDGMAEVIKYGVLADEALFRHLADNVKSFDREYVVSRCIEIKRDIVEADEFDNGIRQTLNLGHTLGHAAEKLSCFGLSHGRAVAAGMCAITRAAAAAGICSQEASSQVDALISETGLPISFEYSIEELSEAAMKDKKRRGGSISIIVPERIGNCRIEKMDFGSFKRFAAAGL